MSEETMDGDKSAVSAYLGKGIRRVGAESSLLVSSSRWLNNRDVREILATWLLRKNGPDFPVEADHTLGMREATEQVVPLEEVEALMVEERRINPTFDAFMEEGFFSRFRNEDFDRYAPGTFGGIIGRQIRDFGFDLTLGVDMSKVERPPTNRGYWYLRTGQTHDFEHIAVGGQFNSIGEIVVIFAKAANNSAHLSPRLASAFNAYLMFSGFRMVSRSLLHYPETWPKALECLEQGIRVGRASAPMYAYRYEDVFHLTPEQARETLGVQHAYEVDSEREAMIFREEPAQAAAE
jgi:ubiquinone biosynthesis protein Coq4